MAHIEPFSFTFRDKNTPYYEGDDYMFIAKKFIIKFAISLTAGVASTVGIRLTNAIWDKCTCNKTYEKKEKTFAQ